MNLSPFELQLIKKIDSLLQRQESLEVQLKSVIANHKPSEWLTLQQIEDEYGIKPRTISQARRDGILTKYKCSRGGKNHRYPRKEIETKMFLKVA